MGKPNIFKLATKELSQDSFFTWLIQWADCKYSEYNKDLNEAAQDFIRLLIGQTNNYKINQVIASRQWHNIDIRVEVNNEYFIGIEDKTNSKEHSKQLERYKVVASNHYKDKGFKLVFVYLKTGNESLSTLNKVKEKDYLVIDRKAILQILNSWEISNDIFSEFKVYLNEIEEQTNSFGIFKNITSDWRACEGFYSKLQENITEWTDWGYVSNQMGGFLGFWYHWNGVKELGEIYIQIENAFENGIKLVIKIGAWKRSTETLYKILNELKPYAENNRLLLLKPDRYRPGETSTLAIIQNAFPTKEDGTLNFNSVLNTLKALEKTIDEYCDYKNKISDITGNVPL